MRTDRSPLPVILFPDPYLAAHIEARSMDASRLLRENITEARLIAHVLRTFFRHEDEILRLLYGPRAPTRGTPGTSSRCRGSPRAERANSARIRWRGWVRSGSHGYPL